MLKLVYSTQSNKVFQHRRFLESELNAHISIRFLVSHLCSVNLLRASCGSYPNTIHMRPTRVLTSISICTCLYSFVFVTCFVRSPQIVIGIFQFDPEYVSTISMVILADAPPNHILNHLLTNSSFNKEVQYVWIHSYIVYLYPAMMESFNKSGSRTGGLEPLPIVFL